MQALSQPQPCPQEYGGGHHSPVAAYHQDSDSFLVLDVSRYKWVGAARLSGLPMAQHTSSLLLSLEWARGSYFNWVGP